MNFHYLLKEIGLFLAVILFFVAPSILVGEKSELVFQVWNFPILQLSMAVCGLLVCYIKDKNLISIKKTEGTNTIVDLGVSFFSFGMLCLISALLQAVSYFFFNLSDNASISFPSSVVQFVFFILTFLFSAVFEESIFRIYLPRAFYDIFNCHKLKGLAVFIISEVLPCILFAFCHRYLGWFAVINAFFCHFVLRLCYLKTSSFLFGVSVHCLYNVLNFIVLCYLN